MELTLMRGLRVVICLLLVSGVLLQAAHTSFVDQIAEVLEISENHDLDDLDKKEKDQTEKFNYSSHIKLPSNLLDSSQVNLNTNSLALCCDFLDSMDIPPEQV